MKYRSERRSDCSMSLSSWIGVFMFDVETSTVFDVG